MMGRGYWLPPSCETLTDYDGFYIESSAVYKDSFEQDWDEFLNKLCIKLSYQDKTLKKKYLWKSCAAGQSRFVVLANRHVDFITEEFDNFIAVYVVIPEDCECLGFAKRSFPQYVKLLKEVLTDMYPGSVYMRINSQKIKSVE